MKLLTAIALSIAFTSVTATASPVALLKCPAIPDSYSKILSELRLLKSTIKKDASCDAVQTQVQGLENLLGSRRESIVALIKKSKTEPLQDKEMKEVNTYVDDVTRKVFQTAELLDRNNTCFESEKQKLGLSDLASITLDATALAKTVAGPFGMGMPVAIGGQALAGVIQGLDKVVKSRRGYDFEKIDQRQSFVQSLCSYYNYRQDIEHLLYPKRRVSQLKGLERTLKQSLQELQSSCEDCQRVVELANEDSDPSAARQAALQANRTFVRPLGTHTMQTISSVKWASSELSRLQEEMADDSSIGRDLVSETKTEIDRFLFEKEAPKFVQFQNRKALALFQEFSSFTKREGEILLQLAWPHVASERFSGFYKMNEKEMIQAVAGSIPELRAKRQNSLVHRMVDFERKAVDLLDRTSLAVDVQRSYCDFFKKAGVYNGALENACEHYYARQTFAKLDNLESIGGARMVSFETQQPEAEISTDWVDGLEKMIGKLSQDPDRFRRK